MEKRKYKPPVKKENESATDYLQRCLRAKIEQQGEENPLVEESQEEIYKQFKKGV